jgi:vacuolar-type H+-ATPase subunit I/STV1
MKPFSIFLRVSARVLLLLSVFWICACRENPRQVNTVDSEANTTVTQQEELPDERITELQRKIEAGQQNIKNIEAFVQMERAKLKENPDYDSSFLQQALFEQQKAREAVESCESRLRELAPESE